MIAPVKLGKKFLLIKLVLINTENNKIGTTNISDNGPYRFFVAFFIDKYSL